MPTKCPACGSSRVTNNSTRFFCKKCKYTNKKFNNDEYITDVEDKKHDKRYKTGGHNR